MKIAAAAVLAALAANPSTAFAPTRSSIATSTAKSSSLLSTITPPERVAPDAGYVPEWEGRTGL